MLTGEHKEACVTSPKAGGKHKNKDGVQSQSPAVVLRERRGKTAGWMTNQRRSERSTTELFSREKPQNWPVILNG